MADRYTWENVIFNPKSDEVENIISKECYFGDSPAECLKRANTDMCMGTLESINPESIYPFHRKNGDDYGCIIQKRDLSYAERASKWIEENDLKVGDYVRVTRKAKSNEKEWSDSWSVYMDYYIGKTVCVDSIGKEYGTIFLSLDNSLYNFPYFVLEKVENPKCVPFTSMEELASTYEETMQGYDIYTFIDNLRCNGMWIRCKEDHGVYQIVGMSADGVIVAGFEKKKTWEELFNEFEFLNKKPCGKEAYTQKSQQ